MALVDRLSRSLPGTALALLALLALAVSAGLLFKLTVAGSLGLYFVVWWTLLFAVLPFSVRTQAEDGEIVAGSDPGAPSAPQLRKRAIWTSVVSTAAFTVVAALFPLSGL